MFDYVYATEAEVQEHFTWLYEVVGFYPTRQAVEDAIELCLRDQAAEREAEARAESWAESAWLRAAEAGSPESWAEEDYDRMVEARGYGSPFGAL